MWSLQPLWSCSYRISCARVNGHILSIFSPYRLWHILRWDWENQCKDVFWGWFRQRARAITFHRHLPVAQTLQKPNCVKWEKLQVHIPEWCAPSCLPLSTRILAQTHIHTPSSWPLPLIWWWEEVGWWWGVKGRSSFTVIIESFLHHEMDAGEGWN